jgi:ribosomal subunit interface protein
MTIPVQIMFHGIEASPAIDEYIRKRVTKLETFSQRVTSCRVAVEAPHHHQKHGFGYRIRVEMNVPGAALVIAHNRVDEDERRDVYAAVDDAFDSAGRVLQDHVRRQRGDTKLHEGRG